MHSPDTRSRGFTLIELSIVLVIIGLIIGGILAGRDLVKAAENRAFISQIEKYNTAANTFKLKYDCLPGDCPNAKKFGFVMNGNGNGFVSALSIDGGATSVDGDNSTSNGVMFVTYDTTDGNAFPGTAMAEGAAFWEELQQAGLIDGMMKIGVDGGGYPLKFPMMKSSGEWLALGALAGRHYYRTGMTQMFSQYMLPCRFSFTPADVFYIATKIGQVNFTAHLTGGISDAISQGDRLVLVGADTIGCPNTNDGFYSTPLNGAGGASADVCLNTNTTPPSLNLANSKKLCNLMIRAEF